MDTDARKPNVLFILIDDLGWADLGCYGSSFYETPVLDGLADEGMLFTNAYAAAPVCSPTRASILSGKYPARVGVTDWIGAHAVGSLSDVPYFHELPMNEYSLARALRDNGYQTWHVGKWHLGTRRTWPDRHGFDMNVGGCEWGHPPTYWSPYHCPSMPDGPGGEYLTDRLTDEAVRLIENAGEQPFFLNLWHYAVHTPIQSPPELVRKYEQKASDLGLDRIDPIEEGEPHPSWHLRHQRVRRRRVQSDPVYAAMVENLDDNIGRVLDALQRTGKTDDTIVVFTSDNGGLATSEGSPTCNAPLAEGKGWMYDGGVRVPLLIRWPAGVAAGRRTDEPVTSPDFYPTLLEAAGLPAVPDQHVDGISFVPLLRGEPFSRGPIFWHYPHYGNQGGTPGAAVRDGTQKLIRFFEDDHVEQYHLTGDIGEATDIAGPDSAETDRLAQLLDQWIDEIGGLIPKPNPRPPFDDLPGGG